ncbi:MAG: chromate efflux transporter [Pseudomonadota bacterium]
MNQSNISFRQAIWFWLKLGLVSFGGPAGQIAIMHQELVEKRCWISESRYLHALNYCMLLPGPEAQQLATYIGWLIHKTWGGIIAGVLFVVPSLLILILLSWVYLVYGDVTIVAGLFYGIKPAVTAIVIYAAYRIGSRALKNTLLVTIAIAAFIAIFVFKLPFPAIVLAALLLGIIGGRLFPEKFSNEDGQISKNFSSRQAIIDDDTPVPNHARFKWSRLTTVLIIGLLFWLSPMLFMLAYFGWENTFTQMSWFFTKAALVTFGGAYAVLPYVYQGAVEHYEWVTALQMIDGLALGETTPGPLIMVVAFVGFVGGYINEEIGVDNQFLAGAAAATIVTWFTFLPSFIFIFMGGPFIETTHGNIKFTAPLSAITAAVVGVILNLALFFGYHVLWPTGFEGTFDWVSALISLISGFALFYYKLNIMAVILLSGLIGLIYQLLFLI